MAPRLSPSATCADAGTTILNGPTSVSSSALWLDSGRTLHNNATLTWTGGTIDLNFNVNGLSLPGSASLTNAATGLFLAQGDGAFSISATNFGDPDTGASSIFTNAGTFRKAGSDPAHQTTISTTFNNSGTVDVQTGILSLAGGGTHPGTFSIAAGATLDFSGGTHALSAPAVTSLGTFRVSGGTVNATSSLTTGGLEIGGVLNIGGAVTTNQLTLTGGVLNAGGNITTTTYTQSNGSLQGPGTLTVQGAATITFGDMRDAGTTILNGPTSISSSALWLDSGRTLHNNATLTWTGGTIDLNFNVNGLSLPGSASLTNAATGLFLAQGDGAFSISATNFGDPDTGASSIFTNAGTFRKAGSDPAHQTTISTTFNNSGTVDVQTGILSLAGGGTHTGSFATAVGTTLDFSGGTHNLNNASAVSSLGTLRISGGTTVNTTGSLTSGGLLELTGGVLNAGGNITTTTYTQSNGSLQGPGTLTVQGAATITFGDMRDAGTTILNGPTSISSSALWLDSGRTLHNNATLTWTGGTIDLNFNVDGLSLPGTASLTNAATGLFLAQGDGAFSISASNFGDPDTGASATFTNAGTFRKAGSEPRSPTSISTIFNNSGTVDVQTGILSLSGGGTHTGSFATAAGDDPRFQRRHPQPQQRLRGELARHPPVSGGTTVNTTGPLTSGGLLDLTERRAQCRRQHHHRELRAEQRLRAGAGQL